MKALLVTTTVALMATATPALADQTACDPSAIAEAVREHDAHERSLFAVDAELHLTQVSERALFRAYFENLEDVTRLTPDGRGYFQYYRGAHGRGAIYYDTLGYSQRAVRIYGAILAYFEANGWETAETGYPADREQDAVGTCKAQGGVRQQRFSRPGNHPGHYAVLCWSPQRGVWPLWIPHGKS